MGFLTQAEADAATAAGVVFADGVARTGPPIIAPFGDSIANANFDGSDNSSNNTTTRSFSAKGPVSQVVALLKGRAQMRYDLNYGVDSKDSTDFLSRLPQVVASPASIIVVQGPTNDFTNQLMPIATTVANMTAIYAGLVAAGKTVIAQPIMPRGAWYTLSAGDQAIAKRRIQRFNSWLRSQAFVYPANKFYVGDADVRTLDWGNASYTQIGSVFRDGLHPNGYGGLTVAGAGGSGGLFSIFDRFLPPRPAAIYSPADLYDATDNPFGALNANPRMTGSQAASGAGFSGNIPLSTIAARDTGTVMTGVASLVTADPINGGQLLRVTLGATGLGATSERLAIYQTTVPSASTYQAGDTVYGEAEIDQSALVGVQSVDVQVLEQGSATRTFHGLAWSASNSDREYPTLSRTIRTPTFVIAAGVTGIQIRVYIRAATDATAPSGNVDIREMALRKA